MRIDSRITNRSASRDQRRRRGLTLVEVLFASAIVALGMLATLTMLTAIRINNSIAQERSRARQVIYLEVEGLRYTLYSRLRPSRTVTVWDNGTPDDPQDDMQGQLQIVLRDSNGAILAQPPATGAQVQAEVSLSWNPRGRLAGKTLTETMMTYFVP